MVGYLLMLGRLLELVQRPPRAVEHGLSQAADLSSGLHGHGHGMNDAQKTMGIITLALFVAALHPGH